MQNVVLVPNIVEANGKTIRENNMQQKHTLPLGALVEVRLEYNEDLNGLRLWVAQYSRDCDGEPLYDLSFTRDYALELAEAKAVDEHLGHNHFSERVKATLIKHFSADSLELIRI
jgi:hypothetical protein